MIARERTTLSMHSLSMLVSGGAVLAGLCWGGELVAKTYSLSGSTKALNAFLKSLIQLGIPSGSTVVLTAPGRKTGQPRSTPVNLVLENGKRYVVSPYGEVAWVKNIRAGGRARLTHRGRTEDVRLVEVPAAVAAPLLKKYVESYRIAVPYFDAKPTDPVERFAAEADKHPVFAILPS
jgi:deazaflavin-dependent oxidoreductase (nitroreductase family)